MDNKAIKLQQWERKLLDLGLRNPLINMRFSRTLLPILSTSLGELEDELSDGTDFKVCERPEGFKLPSDEPSFELFSDLGAVEAEVQAGFKKKCLHTAYTEKELKNNIKNLFRAAKASLEENGANTLYLALGLLKWYEDEKTDTPRYAPIILLPIEIVKKFPGQNFAIRLRDEDPILNITIFEKLKQDFQIAVEGLDPIPLDEHGIDIRKIFDTVKASCAEKIRWGILESAYLGIFSFSQFVMWNDLRNRSDDLIKNKIVQSLMEGKLSWIPEDLQIGDRVSEDSVFLPLSADASQLFAIEKASEGVSFVLHGPPGTGKSQTITALIANALARGKTVLFVAEKMAALEVVERRLDKIGIGDFCLELHSNKAKKKSVLEQLRVVSEIGRAASQGEYERKAREIAEVRKTLDEYAKALHEKQPSALSLYEMISRYEDAAEKLSLFDVKAGNASNAVSENDGAQAGFSGNPGSVGGSGISEGISVLAENQAGFSGNSGFSKDGALSLMPLAPFLKLQISSPDILSRMDREVDRLITAAGGTGHPFRHPLERIGAIEYTREMKEGLSDAVNAYSEALFNLKNADSAYAAKMGEIEGKSLEVLIRREKCALALIEWLDLPRSFAEREDYSVYLGDLRDIAAHGMMADKARQGLLSRWNREFLHQNGDELLSEFNDANSKWFIFRSSALNKLSKKMAVFQTAGIERDKLGEEFLFLSSYQRENREVQERLSKYRAELGALYKGEETDWQAVTDLSLRAEKAAKDTDEAFGSSALRIKFAGIKDSSDAAIAFLNAFKAVIGAKDRLYGALNIRESAAGKVSGVPGASIPGAGSSVAGSAGIPGAVSSVAPAAGIPGAISAVAPAAGIPGAVSADAGAAGIPGAGSSVTGAAGNPGAVSADALVAGIPGAVSAVAGAAGIPDTVGAGQSDWIQEEKLLCLNIMQNADKLREWTIWKNVCGGAGRIGLNGVIEAYEAGIPHEKVKDIYNLRLYQAMATNVIDASPVLSRFSGNMFDEEVRTFKRLDSELMKLSQNEIFCILASKLPNFAREASESSEVGILQKAIKSGGRALSIRRLFERIPTLLPRLCPCMLMSPISAAQYLDPKREPFDIVVFDEASQLQTSKAVGVIARGRDAVIVGDPKQMPPTSFFAVNAMDEENLELEDLESILDDCLALNMPETHLLWHYRSRHESLISFSNKQFYENQLYTFPSVNDRESKVSLVKVNGIFDRGKTRQNRAEAEAVVAELKRRCHDKLLRKFSVGVVTFNISQQNLIDDLLSDECVKDKALENWAYNSPEPIFIKNLESVQGDERDVILFSVGYGRDSDGKVSMNFGPLNRDGGWRRLNVAVSRSRYEMMIFSSLAPEDIRVSDKLPLGVAALREFLKFAEESGEAAASSMGISGTIAVGSGSAADGAMQGMDSGVIVADGTMQGMGSGGIAADGAVQGADLGGIAAGDSSQGMESGDFVTAGVMRGADSGGIAADGTVQGMGSGGIAGTEAVEGTVEPGHGIISSLCKALLAHGYRTDTGVGHSKYRVDIGVVNPKHPERYLLGILLDSENYASAKTTRDRELSEESVLKGLGWAVLRVWTMDFWENRDKEIERILSELKRLEEEDADPMILLEQNAANANFADVVESAEGEGAESDSESEGGAGTQGEAFKEASGGGDEALNSAFGENNASPDGAFQNVAYSGAQDDTQVGMQDDAKHRAQVAPEAASQADSGHHVKVSAIEDGLQGSNNEAIESLKSNYRSARLRLKEIPASDFLSPDYEGLISQSIRTVCEKEAPIKGSLLMKRVLQVFSLERSSAKIQDYLRKLCDNMGLPFTLEGEERVYWGSEQNPEAYRSFRLSGEDADKREIKDLPLCEAANAILYILSEEISVEKGSLLKEAAAQTGYPRMGSTVQAVFQSAFELCEAKGLIEAGGNGFWHLV